MNNETKFWWMCVNQSTPEQKFWWIYYWKPLEWFPLSRYFPIIVFENLRWSWNLGQLYFVFGVPLQLKKKCNTQCCAQKSNDCEMHCRRSNTSKETDFLLCVVALIRISTFTFHGLMNFCTHASLQLLVVVLQVPTLKASLILPSLVKIQQK